MALITRADPGGATWCKEAYASDGRLVLRVFESEPPTPRLLLPVDTRTFPRTFLAQKPWRKPWRVAVFQIQRILPQCLTAVYVQVKGPAVHTFGREDFA